MWPVVKILWPLVENIKCIFWPKTDASSHWLRMLCRVAASSGGCAVWPFRLSTHKRRSHWLILKVISTGLWTVTKWPVVRKLGDAIAVTISVIYGHLIHHHHFVVFSFKLGFFTIIIFVMIVMLFYLEVLIIVAMFFLVICLSCHYCESHHCHWELFNIYGNMSKCTVAACVNVICRNHVAWHVIKSTVKLTVVVQITARNVNG